MATAQEAGSSRNLVWETDRRGYPERTFPTKILPIDSSSIQFRGEGSEPYQHAALEVATGSQTESCLQQATDALTRSHLVAFPTETVYGLGANALDAEAALKIFRAKGRPVDNPLIVHISDLDMLQRLVPDSYQISPVYAALANKFWPGAITLLVPVDEEKVPSVVRCGLKTLGVRMPSHPVARALIASSQLPLAAPSANASGRPSPTTAMHVYRDMTSRKGDQVQGRLPFILDGGPCQVGVESTVVDGVTEAKELRVLRPGGVGVEEIKEALKERDLLQGYAECTSDAVRLRVYGKDMARDKVEEANPTTPGMKYRHYSPDAAVVLLVEAEGRRLTEEVFGSEASHSSPTVPLLAAVESYITHHPRAGSCKLRVGLMSLDDSKLTKTLLPGKALSQDNNTWSLHRYSLGSQSSPQQAAQRLFDGLRSLDEGDHSDGSNGCDVIFVEALSTDAGLGLAIMNRLQKAASSVIHVAL